MTTTKSTMIALLLATWLCYASASETINEKSHQAGTCNESSLSCEICCVRVCQTRAKIVQFESGIVGQNRHRGFTLSQQADDQLD